MAFRVETRIASPHLSGITEQYTLPFADCSADQLIAKIQNISAPTKEWVRLAAAHPDERVPIAAIQHWGNRLWSTGGEILFERAIRICEDEKIAWHPIFDAIAATDCWPSSVKLDRRPSHYFKQKYWIDALGGWLQAQTHFKRIHPLLDFHTESVFHAVAQHAAVLSESLVRRLIETHPSTLAILARRRDLSERVVRLIVNRGVDLLAQSQESQHISISKEMANSSMYALEVLAYRKQLRSRCVRRLVDATAVSPFKYEIYQVLWALGTQLKSTDLKTVFRTFSGSHRFRLLQHPAATEEFWNYALNTVDHKQLASVRLALSLNPDALRNPELRRKILEAPTKDLIQSTLLTVSYADSSLFLAVLEHCMSKVPAVVTDLLRNDNRKSRWRKRVLDHHLDHVIELTLRTEDVTALKNLLLYRYTARDERLLTAFVRHRKATINELFIFAERARGEDLRHIAKRVAQKGDAGQCMHFLDRIVRCDLTGHADLSANDLVPFLTSKNRDVRTYAIRALAVLQGAAHEPHSHRSDSSSRHSLVSF